MSINVCKRNSTYVKKTLERKFTLSQGAGLVILGALMTSIIVDGDGGDGGSVCASVCQLLQNVRRYMCRRLGCT